MGGNALKNCTTRRYDAREYFPLEAEVLNRLRSDFPGRRIDAIKAYAGKQTFGDMDVLFQSDQLHQNLIDYLTATFSSKEIVQNGSVYSFEHREFQIDLILTPEKHFQTSLNYFSFNDLGNLLGRVSHAMGLKLGHNGLCYAFRDGTYMFAEIEIEHDWKVILPTLGYSYERWAKGFNGLQEIFEYVISSPFFNREIYLLHNRNHTSRVRDAKRKTYMEFLQWLQDAPEDTFPAFPRKEDKAEWLPYLFDQLPGFKEQYDVTLANLERSVLANQRFNGELVASITGLTDKNLGALMRKIRESFGGKEELKNWVGQASDEDIRQKVLEIHESA